MQIRVSLYVGKCLSLNAGKYAIRVAIVTQTWELCNNNCWEICKPNATVFYNKAFKECNP